MNKNNDTNKNLVDLTALKTVANGDSQFIKKMILLFIDDTPKQISQIENALLSKNRDQISAIAHKLKPSLDYLSNRYLQEKVRNIENSQEFNDEFINKTNSFISDMLELIDQLKKQE